MAHPYEHARSSAKKYGGEPNDYVSIHSWFDQTKAHCADPRHRLILHNSFGIFLCEQQFGVTFTRESDGGIVRTRLIAEQHVNEDFGGVIPSLNEVLSCIELKPWMGRNALKLSKLLAQEDYEDGLQSGNTSGDSGNVELLRSAGDVGTDQ